MTRTIWLASYPKSGNTWLCILIANALAKNSQPADINKLFDGDGGGGTVGRAFFDYVILIDSGLLTHDEIDCLRPRVYKQIASAAPNDNAGMRETQRAPRFLKAHDAYTKNPAEEPLLGGSEGAFGAIVVVRDPRDVAPSLANYSGWSLDEAIDFMNDDDAALGNKTDRQYPQLRQKLYGWSRHVASWLDQKDIPVHLVRYEDLRKDTAATLRGILAFAGVTATEEEICRAIAFSDFARLRDVERRNGFMGAPRSGTKFFRRGEVGSWRDELHTEQVARIESHHERMMLRLGYELSCVSKLARVG